MKLTLFYANKVINVIFIRKGSGKLSNLYSYYLLLCRDFESGDLAHTMCGSDCKSRSQLAFSFRLL